MLPAAKPLAATPPGVVDRPDRNRLRILMLKAERTALDRRVAALNKEVSKLKKSLDDKNSHIEQLGAWAASLDRDVGRKNRELERQSRIINRLPKGVLKVLSSKVPRSQKARSRQQQKGSAPE